jgi:PKHD-type hydroxylase
MTQHLPIWYLGAIAPEMCDKAKQDMMSLPMVDAAMGIDGDVKIESQRNTDVVFAPFDFWLADYMEQFASIANAESNWGYEIPGREAIQFAQYGVGQHYDWHVDYFPLAGKDTDRKVSVVCLLNDPSEFEGGEFQLRLYSQYTAPLVKGSIIAFPSILEHRVTPVTSGVRYSATMWFHGPRFR